MTLDVSDIASLLAHVHLVGFEWAEDEPFRHKVVAVAAGIDGPDTDALIRLCWDDDPLARHLGARLVNYSGVLLDSGDVAASFAEMVLLRLAAERVEEVRAALAEAVASSEDPVLTAALCSLLTDPSPWVRVQACIGLSSPFYGEALPRPRVDLLIALLSDEDEMVRSFAVLGLAHSNTSDPRISEALFDLANRVELPAEDVGYICGRLAEQADPRALAFVEAALSADDVSVWAVEAAAQVRSPTVARLLTTLRDRSWAQDDLERDMLDRALLAQGPETS